MSSAPGSGLPHGLPAKPGGPLPAFQPAFQPAARPAGARPGQQQHAYSQGAYAAAAPPTSYQASPVVASASYNPYGSYAASAAPSPAPAYGGYGQQQQAYSGYQQQQAASPYAAYGYDSYTTSAAAPQIQNPFPLPGQPGSGKGNGYDPEREAEIAMWNSAYAPKDEAALKEAAKKGPMGNANTIPLGQRDTGPALTSKELSAAVPVGSKAAAVVTGTDGKQKTVIRSGGGKTWQDSSLLEWDPAHPRLFVGNLAGEVTDDSLHKAFSVYPSIVKARVIRDGRTTKSKGYGFVSFTSTDDFFQAAKEMNGKYIGSHPVIVKRSTTEIKVTAPPKKGGKYNKNNKGNRDNRGGQAAAAPNAGVKKEGKKKNGMKILG